MLVENLGWFMLGAGSACWLMTMYNIYRKIRDNRNHISKFDKMISDLKQTSAVLSEITEMASPVTGEPEVSELTFRDTNGKLQTVKIIVSPTDSHADPKILDANSNEFIFSQDVVDRMRSNGVEPDEAVTTLLRASGRLL